MNYQELRETKLYFIGGLTFLAVYAVFELVRSFVRGIGGISGWYILILFSFLLFASFVFAVACLWNAVKKLEDGAAEKHNYPFWITLFGDLGYVSIVYCVIDLLFV